MTTRRITHNATDAAATPPTPPSAPAPPQPCPHDDGVGCADCAQRHASPCAGERAEHDGDQT
jgi:hypothetical protein